MTESAPTCLACGRPLKPGAAFCAHCGHRQGVAEPLAPRNELALVIRYYLAMLAVAVVAIIYVKVTDQIFESIVIATVLFVVVTIGVAIPHRALVIPAYQRAGFSPLGYLLILVAAPVVLAVVLGYVHGLAQLFRVHMPRELDMFAGHSTVWAIVLVAIVAPLEEELAFRGLIYGALSKRLTVTEVFLISSFAFALLHLAIPSLLTHFPLGLYLCWLRHRSGSLWPPAFAHMCHNLGVIFVEWRGWA